MLGRRARDAGGVIIRRRASAHPKKKPELTRYGWQREAPDLIIDGWGAWR